MRNILSILRRDLGAYFTSPIGYIFIMVFVTISVGLYITSFFGFPVADMRPYFDNLPILLCVFIPAVTMRMWAEERKENTWEMLLTFPMKASELVLGKFFAALVFFVLAMASTVTVPAMLMSLGQPDVGAIFGGYFGTLLLGAFFLALGIFFSGFFKDQIVAFVVTLLTCFLFFLLGTSFIASYIDDKVAGMGSMLGDLLGVFRHYSAFTRGVIDVADVVFFLVWTVLFLVLNVMYIDGRNRPGAKMVFLGAVGVCFAIGMLFNFLMTGQSFKRFDLTEDKIYTISDASKTILSQVDTPVQMKLYISPQDSMPTGMKDLEQNVVDKLEELKVAANGKLDYSVLHLDVANAFANPEDEINANKEKKDETEEETVERRLLDKGVKPFSVRAMSQDEVTNKLVYAALGVAYKDKPEEIIPQIMPETVQELEYRTVSTVFKLTREKAPIVAMVAPKEAVNIDPQMRQMLMQMGQQIPESEDPYSELEELLRQEKYEVQRVELTKESPLPAEYDTLVVVNPRSLNDRQRWEIARAVNAGKSVVMAVQTYEWDYRATPRGTNVTKREEKPEVNQLLESYGLKVGDEILMDENAVTLTVQGGGGLQALMGQPFKLPMHILVNFNSMDKDTSITNRLSSIFYLWGTPLDLNQDKLKELNLNAKVLMSSSERAWTIPGNEKLSGNSFAPPPESARKQFPLMAMVEGQFPDAFAGKERPAWPKPEQQPGQPPQPEDNTPDPPAPPVEAKPGKLILLGCSEMFRKNFLQAGNLDLFLNSVDAVTLNDNLVNVRGRKPIDRAIDRPTDTQKTMWRLVNYGLANVIIAGIGIALYVLRRRARNAYTVAQIQSIAKS